MQITFVSKKYINLKKRHYETIYMREFEILPFRQNPSSKTILKFRQNLKIRLYKIIATPSGACYPYLQLTLLA